MTDFVKQMVDTAISRTDSMSIDELEAEFKSFGLDVVRKETYSSPVPINECLDDPKVQQFLQDLADDKISVGCGPMNTRPWTEQEKLDLDKCLKEIFDKKESKMLGFKEFKKVNGGYVSVHLNDVDSIELKQFFESNDVKEIIDDLHVTVMYDKTNPTIDFTPLQESYKAKVIGAKPLGEKDSQWYAIALLLESVELENQFKDLTTLGFTHSYPEFVPHLSIKYKPTEDDIIKIKVLVDKLKDKELTFGQLQVEKIHE